MVVDEKEIALGAGLSVIVALGASSIWLLAHGVDALKHLVHRQFADLTVHGDYER